MRVPQVVKFYTIEFALKFDILLFHVIKLLQINTRMSGNVWALLDELVRQIDQPFIDAPVIHL